MTGSATRQAIEDLIADYAHCIDNDALEDWPGFFTETGVYRIVTRENFDRGLPAGIMTCTSRGMLVDRILSLRKANIYEPHVYRHLISAIRVTPTDDPALWTAQTSFAVIRTMQEGEMAVFAAGRYLDRVVVQDGRPLFAERVVVLDSRRIDTLIVIPL
jgi:anthranilate 1,2-dioxygenase small subunit